MMDVLSSRNLKNFVPKVFSCTYENLFAEVESAERSFWFWTTLGNNVPIHKDRFNQKAVSTVKGPNGHGRSLSIMGNTLNAAYSSIRLCPSSSPKVRFSGISLQFWPGARATYRPGHFFICGYYQSTLWLRYRVS